MQGYVLIDSKLITILVAIDIPQYKLTYTNEFLPIKHVVKLLI